MSSNPQGIEEPKKASKSINKKSIIVKGKVDLFARVELVLKLERGSNQKVLLLEYLEKRDRSEGSKEFRSRRIQSTRLPRTGRPNSIDRV